MPRSKRSPKSKPLFADPDEVPVHVVDQITVHGMTGSLLDITCCEIRKTPLQDGSVVAKAVAVARLRFNIGLAVAIRDLLDKHIASATKSTEGGDAGPETSHRETVN